jgi:lysophospholipase L1-like esterase
MTSAKYIRVLLLVSLGTYTLLRVVLAGYCEFALRAQDLQTSNRLFNIHILPKSGLMAGVEILASKAASQPGNIIFLGDSQTYGYSRPPQATSAYLLQQEPRIRQAEKQVINMAIVNGRFRDSILVLQALKNARATVDAVILSTNPTHFSRQPPPRPDAATCLPRSGPSQSVFASLLLATRFNVFDLTQVSWKNIRALRPVDLFEEAFVPSDTFAVAQVGPDYCADLDPATVMPDLVELIRLARKLARRVILFTQPRHYADYYQPPFNYTWNPRVVDDAVLATARAEGVHVVLDLADAFPRDHFSDLIHLNKLGHQAVAQRLLPHLLETPP